MPGTVFATPTTLGLPNEVPVGMTKRSYLTVVAAGKSSAPQWSKDDMFVV